MMRNTPTDLAHLMYLLALIVKYPVFLEEYMCIYKDVSSVNFVGLT